MLHSFTNFFVFDVSPEKFVGTLIAGPLGCDILGSCACVLCGGLTGGGGGGGGVAIGIGLTSIESCGCLSCLVECGSLLMRTELSSSLVVCSCGSVIGEFVLDCILELALVVSPDLDG